MLDGLGPTGSQFALGQCFEERYIGVHQARLVECADHVFAESMVNAGLAAHRTVDHGKECCGHLHECDTTQNGRGCIACDITDDPAPEGHHDIAALDAVLE